jgi:hypothetical protein
MGVCVCCLRRGEYTCRCKPGTCRGCLYCVAHCRCGAQSTRECPERLAADDPWAGLDDPEGPFHDLPPRTGEDYGGAGGQADDHPEP